MANELEDYGLDKQDRAMIKILREINDKLARLIELTEAQGRVRPS